MVSYVIQCITSLHYEFKGCMDICSLVIGPFNVLLSRVWKAGAFNRDRIEEEDYYHVNQAKKSRIFSCFSTLSSLSLYLSLSLFLLMFSWPLSFPLSRESATPCLCVEDYCTFVLSFLFAQVQREVRNSTLKEREKKTQASDTTRMADTCSPQERKRFPVLHQLRYDANHKCVFGN